jgi:ribosome-associated protein
MIISMGRGENQGDQSESSYREIVQINSDLCLPLSEFNFRSSRSSGPGGQHANKSETKIEAMFDVLASQTLTDEQKQRLMAKIGPVIKSIAQDERSQYRNKELATKRLSEAIALALKTKRKRVPTKVSVSAKEKRLETKKIRGDVKKMRQTPSDE